MKPLVALRKQAKAEGMAVVPWKTRSFYLKSYGFTPDVVFDVGVYQGTPWLYRSFPDAHFVLVDPQPADALGTEPGSYTAHAVALGAEKGTATLSVPEIKPGAGGDMASLLPRQDGLEKGFTDVREMTVEVTTLDALAADYDGRIGLKIDTEGFEDQILQGAQETLKRTDFAITELSVTQRFDGVGSPSKTIGLLAEAGLEMRDILAFGHGGSRRAKPRHMDVLFTRWADA